MEGRRTKAMVSGYGALPEDCVAKVLSFLSPRDVCRSSLVSKISSAAAQSDAVWDRFLPSEFLDEILRSLHCSSKKELYFSLCDHPVAVHNGRMSIWLEKKSGKKCYFLHSNHLKISQVNFGLTLDGRIKSPMLSEDTFYAFSIVFNATRVSIYRDDQNFKFKGQLVFGDRKINNETGQSQRRPYFRFKEKSADLRAAGEDDGWLKVEVGEFLNEGGSDESLNVLIGIKGNLRKEFVRGMEIMPIS